MALGITEVEVARKPLVGILSSGDEVVHPSEPIAPGQVRDINSYTLQALVRQAGGEARLYGVAVIKKLLWPNWSHKPTTSVIWWWSQPGHRPACAI